MKVHMIIDESGSMSSLRQETIAGFNKFLAEQQGLKNVKPARLSVTLFDSTHIRKPIVDVPINDVKPWTETDYVPGAFTPLLDAVGATLAETKGKNHLAVIITDGFENASREWTKAKVKDLITAKERAGWKVLYFGANVDAFAEAGGIGITGQTVSGYTGSAAGTVSLYAAVTDAVTSSRSGIDYTVDTTATGDPTIVVKNKKAKTPVTPTP